MLSPCFAHLKTGLKSPSFWWLEFEALRYSLVFCMI